MKEEAKHRLPVRGDLRLGFTGLAVAALACALAPAVALAGTPSQPPFPFDPSLAVATSETTAAGHPDVSIHLSKPANGCLGPLTKLGFCRNTTQHPDVYRQQDFKKLVTNLAPGLAPDPNAVPQCQPNRDESSRLRLQPRVYVCATPEAIAKAKADPNCRRCLATNAASQIGTVTASAFNCYEPDADSTKSFACGASDENMIRFDGEVYLGIPRPGEQGHLVILAGVKVSTLDLPDAALIDASLNVDASGRVTATADTLPDAPPVFNPPSDPGSPFPIQLKDMTLTLWGKAGESSGHPLLTNPTSCTPKQFTGTVGGYAQNVHFNRELGSGYVLPGQGDGTTVPVSADFPVTGCDKVAYNPSFDLRLDNTAPQGYPSITTAIGQSDGEATTGAIGVTFPKGFRINFDNRNGQCTGEQFAARACPASAAIGSAEADSRLLPAGSGPLKGNVYLGPTEIAAGKVSLTMNVANDWLPGGIDIRGHASLGTDGLLRATFANLPELPIRNFKLTLLGGKDKSLLVSPSACGAKQVTAAFNSHSGKAVERTAPVHIDCTQPKLAASLGSRRPGSHPSLYMQVSSSGVKSVSFRLPTGLKVAKALTSKKTYGSLGFISAAGSKDLKVVAAKSKAKRRTGKAKRRVRKGRTAATLVVLDQGAIVSQSSFAKRSNKLITISRLPEDTTTVTLELTGKRDRLLTLPSVCKSRRSQRIKSLYFQARVTDNDGGVSTPTVATAMSCKHAKREAKTRRKRT